MQYLSYMYMYVAELGRTILFAQQVRSAQRQ